MKKMLSAKQVTKIISKHTCQEVSLKEITISDRIHFSLLLQIINREYITDFEYLMAVREQTLEIANRLKFYPSGLLFGRIGRLDVNLCLN